MNPSLGIALVSACAALLGSVVGGLISYLTTRHLKLAEWRQTRLDKEIAKREDLYAAILSECSRMLLKGEAEKITRPTEFTELYTLFSKVRMVSDKTVTEAMIDLMSGIYRYHTKDNGEEGLAAHRARDHFTLCARAEIEALKGRI